MDRTTYSQAMDTTEVAFGTELLQLQERPWESANSLYQDFWKIYCEYPGLENLVELAANFEQLCADQVTILEKLEERTTLPPESIKRQLLTNVKEDLRLERNTWKLFKSLFDDRINKAWSRDENQNRVLGEHTELISDYSIHADKVSNSQLYRELNIIVSWLESNASEVFDDTVSRERFSEMSLAWESGLHALRTGNVPHGGLQAMDPDALFRAEKGLNPEDSKKESSLISQLFTYIRCGQTEKAKQLCRECGESWRAGCMEGLCLYDDPNLTDDKTVGGKVEIPYGNKRRSLSKKIAWSLSENKKLSQKEQALWGALSGKLSAMLPYCKVWEDRLWALCLAAREAQWEDALSQRKGSENEIPRLIVAPEDVADFDLDGIFGELEAASVLRIQQEKTKPHALIQKFLILDDTETLVKALRQKLCEEDEGMDPPSHLVRLAAHLVLLFRRFPSRFPYEEDDGNVICELYVNDLGRNDRGDEISHYVAQLPPPRQTIAYAKYLQKLEPTREERKYALERAKEATLDLEEICVRVVENSITDHFAELGSDKMRTVDFPQEPLSAVPVSEEDQQLCATLEWLLLEPDHSHLAMVQANSMIRKFLGHARFAAAKLALSAIKLSPSDIEAALLTPPGPSMELDVVREFISHKFYIDVHNVFGEWTRSYHQKPEEPVCDDPGSLNFTEKAIQENELKKHSNSLAKWEQEQTYHSESLADRLFFILQFPSGWLCDTYTDSDAERLRELKELKKTGLPMIVSMALKLFRVNCDAVGLSKITSILATPSKSLKQSFTEVEWKSVLIQLRGISIDLLEKSSRS